MSLISKLQPVIIIAAALLGLLLGAVTPLGSVSSGLIEVFLMMLLYILFLSIDLKQIQKSFTNVRFTLTAVIINFVFTPLFGYLLGRVFFADSLDIRIGLLMLLVTPCTDWYLVFTGLSKGNVELGMSILPLNLILQIALLPVYLLVLIGSEVTMNVASLLGGVAMVLVKMFIPLLIFFAVLLFVSQCAGRLIKFSRRDIVSLNFTTLARNSPLSLAIAVATFPDRPLISLALVIGPLIELPVLSVISDILKRWNAER